MSSDEEVDFNVRNSRRRKKNSKEYKRAKDKTQRYSSDGKNPVKECHHPLRSYCKQELLQPDDIQDAFDDFYTHSDKISQDQFILSSLMLKPVKRKRILNHRIKRNIEYTIHYYVTKQDGRSVEVCSRTFLSIFCIGPKRVRNIAKHKWTTNNPRPEKRGGARLNPDYLDLTTRIKQHILSFRCVSSHYGRNKTPHRKYLPSGLNVNRMFKLFLEEYDGPITVKYKYYYDIFMTNFNLGFGNPRKDVCSVCVKAKASIKNINDPEEKKRLVTELLVHKMRARKFYSLLKEEHDDSVLTLCFDLMQNQALPKSPIGEAYYARQLWLYFLGIIEHHPGEQSREDVMFYTWGEHEHKRGANQVSSALTDCLRRRLSVPNHGIRLIRLFSDSCVGQNKNFAVLSAINILAQEYRVTIQHIFPVRGHSFMPADRAFGRVEQILCPKETILLPHEYYTAFNEVGYVRKHPEDWNVFNFKLIGDTKLQKPHSFKITEVKMLLVRPPPAQLTIMSHYSAAGCQHTLLKRGHIWSRCVAEQVDQTNCVKAAKKRDVIGLLTSMGEDTVQAVKDFYDPICRDDDHMETDSEEDEATVELNEDPWLMHMGG